MSECVKALPCYGSVDNIQTTDIQLQLNLNTNSLLPVSVAITRVEYVIMKVIVFLLIAGTASARHVPDEHFNTRGINGDVIIETRNDGYISPESIPYVNSDFRPSDKVITTKTYQRFVQSTVKYNEQNHKDSLNNINDYENDYRLRTNAYTTEEYSTTEYTVQDVNVYTNRKDQKYKDNPINQDSIKAQVYQRVSHNVGFIKINEPKLRPENRPAVNNKQDKRRPETSINIPIQNPQTERTNNITNHPKKSGSVLETVLIQPIRTDEPREGIERLPKADSDEPIWIWGTEGTNVTTTELGSLDDRAAFNGDQCPTDESRGRVTTDGLLSALARLRRPPPPLPHPSIPTRPSDGRNQAPKIHSSHSSPEHAAGAEDSMTVARGESSPERLGGALRRLHYRATRRAQSAAARHHSTPKVVVMGSSTTSDKTINTSTDSAATALTSVTGTDDSMDAETDLIDADPPQPQQEPQNPPSTAPPHYHRAQNSCEFDAPAYTIPQSATDTMDSPRPGPGRFIFDVQVPDPKKEKSRNKTQVSQTGQGGPATSIQIPYDPKCDPPKSPKGNQIKYETHFDFEPETVLRRGSEPRMKNKQKMEKQEYYKDEVAKLRRQLEGTEVFTKNRRRSSTHQHSVPPPSSRRQSTAAQVHVTANPLDSASSMPAGRTTIVVQQPSLSLDYGGCSTILVRDGDERRTSRVCNDHIQQLLDVTSQFTSEDLHEFDKRYGSPHHSRSQSVKAQRSRTGERQLLGLPQQRARVASMPNTGVEEEYYRLRHFSITGKGVVNRGDSLRSRRSRSNTSVASSASSTEAVTRASAPCSLASSRDSSAGLSTYRVVVLGGPGVGKSSLVGQFMTSEYLHAYDTSIDDESGEKSVCVLLAGEESEITFLDSPPDHSEGAAHGYCVVYSTADRNSFSEAERRLQALWAAGHTARRAVILVGNKADLARSRVVNTDEGKALATSYECKFIETSVGINHNVDELLVGLLTQIRLKQQHAERVRKRSTSRKNRSRARSPLEAEAAPAPVPATASAASTPRKRSRLSASVKVRGLLGRVWARDSKSKSCENLHVL